MSEEIMFSVTSGYGANTQQPFVAITVGAKDFHTQMSPEQAIEIAHNLLHAAESSLTDAFLVTFLRDRVGSEMPQVVGLLNEFRQWREEREQKQKPG
jgi:mitochondrial fission protein ELM1